jgi:hypothetical protein
MMFKLLFLLAILPAITAGAPRIGALTGDMQSSTEGRVHRALPSSSLDEDSLHQFDVLKFECHLSFNLTAAALSGYTVTKLAANEIPLDQIDFRFNHSLVIDSVWILENYIATLSVLGHDSIRIELSPSLPLGDSLQLGIAYHGTTAIIDPWGGFRWAQQLNWHPQIAWSMGDGLNLEPPPANYAWFPCHSDPTDKVLWEAWLRAPSNRAICSNGIRVDTLNNGDSTTTWHYRLDQPVSTYLISVAVSDYVIMTQRESNPRIENFVYPSRVTQAQTHFSNVPAVLDGFQALFGPYPFERFGYAMTRNGDMEHATCVFHYDQVVVSSNAYDWLLIHELSHQWWGDWVTCGDWRDLWLNEGFATFCEAVGLEVLHGRDAYMDRVTGDFYPAARGASDSYSIYDPDYYWGATVYQKGACVMHMLRELMGDSLFFLSLREFGQEHAFSSAVTADWQAELEQHYGSSLDWFFQPWVYGTRYPEYNVVLDLELAYLIIEQNQPTNTLFRMPIDVRIVSTEGDTSEFTLWNEAVRQQGWMIPNDSMQFTGWPASIEIDPYNKILKTAVYSILVGVGDRPSYSPVTFAIASVYPNPFNPSVTISFDVPWNTDVGLRVFTLTGREVTYQKLGSLAAGSHQVRWDGDGFASGIYLFRIETLGEFKFTKAILLK